MSDLTPAQQEAIANLESGAAALGLQIDPEARQDAIDQATLFDSGGNYIGGILSDIIEASSYSPSSTLPPSPSSTLPPIQNPDKYVYDERSAYSRADFTKNLFGANLDVVSKLEQVTFESGADRSMRNSIAYIHPWTRGGTSTNAQEIGQTQNTPTDDSILTVIPSL